jgi:hypothetical protein
MKEKLGRIAIGLFVVNNTAFDLISIYDNTRLNIMYFSIMYFCFLVFCVHDHFLENIKQIKIFTFGSIMGVGFMARIVIELSKWNMSFVDYMKSVNNTEQNLLFSFFIITIILMYILHGRNK